jgi:hypothetical protein
MGTIRKRAVVDSLPFAGEGRVRGDAENVHSFVTFAALLRKLTIPFLVGLLSLPLSFKNSSILP